MRKRGNALRLFFGLVAVTGFACQRGIGAEWTAESLPTEVSLVELFSSEGCSSCPPAEAWLSTLRNAPGLWKRFVPVEFHVDYWNHLGWQDPYSRDLFTARQRGYAAEWGVSQIYTPAFVRQGKEWRHRGVDDFSKGDGALVGVLKVKKSREGFFIEYAPSIPGESWTVVAALLGNGMVSHVLSGENQGRTLQHEFVVLNLNSKLMRKDGKTFKAEVALFAPPEARPSSKSIAVWVSRTGEQRPVQAVGGELP